MTAICGCSRTSDKINFVDGKRFVKQNVFLRLDPETGRPFVDPVRQPGTDKKADFCPSLWGGKHWLPVAYSPKTRLLYLPANDNLCSSMTRQKVTYAPGSAILEEWPPSSWRRMPITSVNCRPGISIPGRRCGAVPFANSPRWGPVLARAGGVLFAGGTNDRYFRALDASNGKALWEFRTGSGVQGVPVSFAIDGKQYIAVQSGWGVDAATMQARLNLIRAWEFPEVPQGGSVWVFALD